MIRWYFKGTIRLAWNKLKIWNLSFSSLPVRFLLFHVLFVKLLVFAHCVDTKKQISSIFHYLGMSLRNMELLRTPSNRISRKLGSRKLPHLHACKDLFSSYCEVFGGLMFQDQLIQELERKKRKDSAFSPSATRRAKWTRTKYLLSTPKRRCWIFCCLSTYQIKTPPFSTVPGVL